MNDIANSDGAIALGREVLLHEAQAVKDLAETLDAEHFGRAVDLLLNCKGRVVVSGVGKTGHIGRKLAATLASTGTPAFFVHAAEAAHGDLGMIGPEDVAVLISNSGNTEEVVQNVAPLRRNGVTTVAFTSGRNSRLAQACDYLLAYPRQQEADALNLAPTVSSTLTLVLGDAIACELSARRGFTRENFYAFHPNGALGAALKAEREEKA